MNYPATLSALACCVMFTAADAAELRGSAAGEYRHFFHSSTVSGQRSGSYSAVIEPELYFEAADGKNSLTFSPFYRQDSEDPERSHADLRELYWRHSADRYELSLGYRKVFWGTTESQHLVDVINQTDLAENIDGEDKLGQAMFNSRLYTRLGVFDAFILPGFRERTYPAANGRLSPFPGWEIHAPQYEHAREDKHVDWALRWSGSFGSWDFGLAQFRGTNREPRWLPVIDAGGEKGLVPYYEQMRQSSIDVQGAAGPALLKLEAIQRESGGDSYFAFTGGLEYTFYQVRQSSLDVGVVAEYLYDERRDMAAPLFEDDIMVGVRLSPNDVQSTEFLLGLIRDRHDQGRMYRLEAGRRLGTHWRVNVEATVFSGLPGTSAFYGFRNEDFVQAELRYYF